jgi:hypothetical protein
MAGASGVPICLDCGFAEVPSSEPVPRGNVERTEAEVSAAMLAELRAIRRSLDVQSQHVQSTFWALVAVGIPIVVVCLGLLFGWFRIYFHRY